jgi:hypothetical protein
MSDQNDQRRPGTGGEGGDHDGKRIGPSVAPPSPLIACDPDGGIQLGVCAIVAVAGRALAEGTDPTEALKAVLALARSIEVVWLSEQLAEVIW